MLEFEELYLDNLPCMEMYEQSFMHKDTITHVVATKWDMESDIHQSNAQAWFFYRTQFIITCSIDGHIKFWKKQEEGIEFVKHFRGHLGNIQDVAVNSSGTLLCTVSNDKSLKVFDVVNFGKSHILF